MLKADKHRSDDESKKNGPLFGSGPKFRELRGNVDPKRCHDKESNLTDL